MTGRRAWLVNGVLVLAAVLVAAAIAEAGVRLFYPQPLGVWHHDRAGLALHWPGVTTYLPQFGQAVSFNTDGMRDREHTRDKPPGVFRILVLGDSFMEALQIPFEASFPSLLERTLDGKTPKRIEVINASVSGWGTDDELQYLTAYGMRWKPDLVMVAITLHNDISDNLRQRFHTVRNGTLVADPQDQMSALAYTVVQLKGFLATHSHAYQLARRAQRAGEMRGEARQLGSFVSRLFREETSDDVARGLALTARLLEGIKAATSAEGSRLVLVLLPLGLQVSDAKFAEMTRAWSEIPQQWRLDKPQRLVTELATRAGIQVIDLLPAFRDWSAAGGGSLYLDRDGHWNEGGHRLGVEVVSRELLTRGLIL